MSQPNEHILDRLDDYLQGRLSPEAARVVKEHCAGCPSCQLALKEAWKGEAITASPPLKPVVSQSITPRGEPLSPTATRLRRRRRIAIGLALACLLILAGLVIYFRTRGDDNEPPDPLAGRADLPGRTSLVYE